jgi:hypothetical protein
LGTPGHRPTTGKPASKYSIATSERRAANITMMFPGLCTTTPRKRDAREIGGQALRHTIDEILLLRVAAEIGEGQDDDGEAWWTRLVWCLGVYLGRWAGRAALDRIGSHWASDVFEFLLSEIDEPFLQVPWLETDLSEIPSPTNRLGVRSAGEGGTTPALAAVINAVVDALAELGVSHIELPATPERVWRAIQAADQGR